MLLQNYRFIFVVP